VLITGFTLCSFVSYALNGFGFSVSAILAILAFLAIPEIRDVPAIRAGGVVA
jgi:hypothetical protein